MALSEAAIAGLIEGGITLAGSGINYISATRLNRRSYKYNKKLADLAYKQNMAAWRQQAAYNTPAMQAARIRAAGMNPNMAFGNGTEVSSGNTSDAPKLQYADWNPTAPYFDVAGAAHVGIQAAGTASQIMAQVEENQLTRARVVQSLASAGLNTAQAYAIYAKTPIEASQLLQSIEESRQRVDLLKSQVTSTNLDNEHKEFVNSHLQDEYDFKVQMDAAKLELTKSQKISIDRAMKREYDLAQSLIDQRKKQNEYTDRLIELTSSQKDLTDEQKKEVAQLTENLKSTKSQIEANTKLIQKKTGLAEKDIQYYVYNHLTDQESYWTGDTFVEPFTDEEVSQKGFKPRYKSTKH